MQGREKDIRSLEVHVHGTSLAGLVDGIVNTANMENPVTSIIYAASVYSPSIYLAYSETEDVGFDMNRLYFLRSCLFTVPIFGLCATSCPEKT